MTPAPEKAAPIPAELAALAWRDLEIAATSAGRLQAHSITLPIEMVKALVADRASQEERVREDERDSPANLAKRVLSMREHLRHERADGADLGTLSVVARTLARLRGDAS